MEQLINEYHDNFKLVQRTIKSQILKEKNKEQQNEHKNKTVRIKDKKSELNL